MQDLHTLARDIGLCRIWWDADGQRKTVSDASLRTIAKALGYPAEDERQIAASFVALEAEQARPPALLVTDVGKETPLPPSLANAQIVLKDGCSPIETGWTLPPFAQPGYYDLRINGHPVTVAVAPPSCPTVASFGKQRIWGPSVQIPALVSERNPLFGTFAELADAVDLFADRGADAVAINPVHALFPGYGKDFSPYSPSSRFHLNTAMGDPQLASLPPLPSAGRTASKMIAWEEAMPQRMAQLRALYTSLDETTRSEIAAQAAQMGERIDRQARFDTLDAYFRAQGANGWRDWPAGFHDPHSPETTNFVRDHPDEIAFHTFAQWLTRTSLAKIQKRARDGGMAVGLVSDLAVGVHTGGADAWWLGDDMLKGLTIGAPPDPLGPQGQNWMLTSFSPEGLKRSGFAPWIETIRSALSVAGAIRIDHAFGLARLWVVPEGRPSGEGAYLRYPFNDLIRLVTLEAHLAGALVIAEDLGTTPEGFGDAICERGILGMSVLWFERAANDGFIGPQDYRKQTAAMTGTHDTTTVAGWWSGRDLDWAQRLNRLPEGSSLDEAELKRAWERGLLWATLTHDAAARPAPDDVEPLLLAAMRHIGITPCDLALVPLEDLLGETDQPNLPGTTVEHPNWRRRLDAPLADMLARPETALRVETLNRARRDGPA